MYVQEPNALVGRVFVTF